MKVIAGNSSEKSVVWGKKGGTLESCLIYLHIWVDDIVFMILVQFVYSVFQRGLVKLRSQFQLKLTACGCLVPQLDDRRQNENITLPPSSSCRHFEVPGRSMNTKTKYVPKAVCRKILHQWEFLVLWIKNA